MRTLILFMGVVILVLGDTQFKFGERSDVVTRDPGDDINYARFKSQHGIVYSKTYDQRMYQYSQEEIESEVAIPVPSAPSEIVHKVTFDKEVSTVHNGLHRDISYHLSLELARSRLRLAGPKNTCTLSIIDYCDYGFYIDFEEVEPTPTFRFLENERMDIEKMDAVVRQYSYALQFTLSESNFTKTSADLWQLTIDKTFQYHLRYGEANRAGRTLYRMARGFDVATDCWVSEGATETVTAVRQIPRYDWAFTQLFPDPKQPFDFMVLSAGRKIQNFELPVGNTTHIFWVQISTKFLICYGIGVILLAMIWGRNRKVEPKKKE